MCAVLQHVLMFCDFTQAETINSVGTLETSRQYRL